MNPQTLLVLVSALQSALEIGKTISDSIQKNADPTPEQQATLQTHIDDLNAQWAALAPKDDTIQGA